MNTQEYVEKYAKEFKSKYIKYFAVQLIIDTILVGVFAFLLIKLMDNSSYLYICIAVFVVLLEITFFFNVKKFFKSFKNLVKASNIYKKYNDALKSFKADNDKALLDEKLNELEQMIKEQEED